ncbi:MAG: DUF4914 family protein, partial [Spirochaetota bacterium]
MMTTDVSALNVPAELRTVFDQVEVILPESRSHLLELTFFEPEADLVEVAYDVPGRGRVVEVTVAKCKNGAAVNYVEPYMRRRDPDAMVIADDSPTDKRRYRDRFGSDFEPVRQETFEWLAGQEKLIVLPFRSGDKQ